MRERRKTLIGRVASNKMQKTIVVTVDNMKRHPVYGKVTRVTHRYKAHDENQECKVGDLVRIIESRPLSHDKRWMLDAILEKTQE